MRKPSSMTRAIGYPLVAAPIFLLCVATVWSCYSSNVSWIIGVIALFVAQKVINSTREVQRYKAWHKAWDAMAAPNHGAASSSPKRQDRHFVAVMAISLITLIVTQGQVQDHLGLAIGTYTVGFALYGLVRLKRKRHKEQAADGVVTWLVPKAAVSPSRADAMRTLPAYSAQVLALSHPDASPIRSPGFSRG